MNKVTLDAGRSIEIEDAAVAALVTDSIERLTQQVTDAQSAQGKAEAERDALDEKLKAAEELTNDAAIAARVEAIAAVQAQARKVVGDEFTCESVDTMTIKREALTAVRDSIAWADKADSYVEAAFDMALEDAGKAPAPVDQHKQLAQDAAQDLTPQTPKVSAYDAHKLSLQNAHKGA